MERVPFPIKLPLQFSFSNDSFLVGGRREDSCFSEPNERLGGAQGARRLPRQLSEEEGGGLDIFVIDPLPFLIPGIQEVLRRLPATPRDT